MSLWAGDEEHPRTISFWIGLVVGGAVLLYGVKGLFGASAATQPPNLLKFLVGAAILHDAAFAPLVVGLGWLTTRVLPPLVRTPIRVALALSALAVAFTWPMVRRYGARESLPSLLPRAYGHSLVVVLVVIWVATAAVVAVRALASRRSPA